MTRTETEGRSILLVDDDEALCRMLEEYLAPEGFSVTAAHDGAAGLAAAAGGEFEIMILDVMMPVMDGFELLRRLRQTSNLPVLMLTARGDDVERIVGLEIGADDYLAKPFNPRELVARLRAILRRTAGPVEVGGPLELSLPAGRLRLDEKDLSARLDDRELGLTGAEFRVLSCLAEHSGSIVSRADLTRQALGRRLGAYDRAIDTHISNLRRKLGGSGDAAQIIRSVRNAGYLLAVTGGTE
jgi:two-component system response regulator CpxR